VRGGAAQHRGPCSHPTSRRLVAFLGGTIGNLYVEERGAFLGALADHLLPGDTLLLGTDLVKPVERLVAAYDDARGITAAFVKNVFVVLNRELGADFDPDAYSYTGAGSHGPRPGRETV
jgi:L-histidine N-alpha-methyltransferase